MKIKQALLTLFFSVLMFGPGLRVAYSEPQNNDLWTRYATPQGTFKCVRINCLAASTTIVPFTAGGSVPWVIPFGSLATFTTRGSATICAHEGYTGDMTIGSQAAGVTTQSTLTDAAGASFSGDGACFALEAAGASHDDIPKAINLDNAPGRRSGICNARTVNNTGAAGAPYPFCRVDTDCTNAGAPSGTTCTGSAPSSSGGAQYTCRALADTIVTICVEQ